MPVMAPYFWAILCENQIVLQDEMGIRYKYHS